MDNSCPSSFRFQPVCLVWRCSNVSSNSHLLVHRFVKSQRLNWFISKENYNIFTNYIFQGRISVFAVVLRKMTSRTITIMLSLLWDDLNWLMLVFKCVPCTSHTIQYLLKHRSGQSFLFLDSVWLKKLRIVLYLGASSPYFHYVLGH